MPGITISSLLKGALVYFGAPMLAPVPNIIVFQYNPESMTRSFTPWVAPEKPPIPEYGADHHVRNADELKGYGEKLAKLSQAYDPAETFSLTLELDAADLLEHPEQNPVAVAVGVADRLAAIEMLLYPPGDSVSGGTLPAQDVSLGATSTPAQADAVAAQVGRLRADLARRDAPIVLFFWGPGRIVPVRITSLSIEEQQYSAALYPVRAKATIGLRVLDLDDLVQLSGDPATNGASGLARACYSFTLAQKRALALANVANARAASIVGMLPI